MIIDLGYNYSVWSYEYDQVLVVASLKMDLNTFCLTIQFDRIHTKYGLGAGTKVTHLDKVEVGTFNKPNNGLIKKLLSKYKYSTKNTFPNDGWSIVAENGNLIKYKKLIDVFGYHKNENKIVSRILKINNIKRTIKSTN